MLSTLSIYGDNVVKIDVGLPNVLKQNCGTTRLMTPRAPDGCVDGCVKYPDAHVEDYPLPDGIVVAVPPSPLLMRKYHGTICNSFQEMWRWLRWMS